MQTVINARGDREVITDMGLHTVGKQLAELTGVSRDQHVLLPSGHMLTYKQLGRRVLETLLVWA